MPEINTRTMVIDKLELKSKIVVEKEDGHVVDRYIVTSVKFEYRGEPASMNPVLMAMASEHEVTAAFSTSQSIMSMVDEDMVEVESK